MNKGDIENIERFRLRLAYGNGIFRKIFYETEMGCVKSGHIKTRADLQSNLSLLIRGEAIIARELQRKIK